jgi:hypothetical protein
MPFSSLTFRFGRTRCSGRRLACAGHASARSSGIQNAPAKALLRQLRETVEDIQARTIERAKQANGKQPRIPWAQLKKALALP